jgi:hypothetical protein
VTAFCLKQQTNKPNGFEMNQSKKRKEKKKIRKKRKKRQKRKSFAKPFNVAVIVCVHIFKQQSSLGVLVRGSSQDVIRRSQRNRKMQFSSER